MFSARTAAADLARNRLAEALAAPRRIGEPILDLTLSNPTAAGFDYPGDLLAPLAESRGLAYAPTALGAAAARDAVAADYARRGVAVRGDRIALTASTSEAYSLLFKLLCDPGDEVMVPRPSYPLFEHLTQLDAVAAATYTLDDQGAWRLDRASLEAAISPRTKAVLLVSPNNPTGSYVAADELEWLAPLCARRGIALIADEVFADYELTPGAAAQAARILAREDVLVFALGGASKSIGLPQLKLAWVAVAGPDQLVRAALGRLELVCDTYLSVSTPVQLAAASLLDAGAAIRRQIQTRISHNYEWLCARAAAVPSSRVLPAGGGWSAILQVPTLCPEEDLVVDLLKSERVLVHPGYFFDFVRESFLVLSLLPPSSVFAEGVSRILGHVQRAVEPA